MPLQVPVPKFFETRLLSFKVPSMHKYSTKSATILAILFYIDIFSQKCAFLNWWKNPVLVTLNFTLRSHFGSDLKDVY